MTIVLLAASFATGLLALAVAFLGWFHRLPFSGIQAGAYWTLTGACLLCGLAAAYTYFNDLDIGGFA